VRYYTLLAVGIEYNEAMMFVFVDESEWPRPKTPGGYTVWAGAALHTGKSKDFFRDLFNLEKKFWHVAEPYDFEIKGRLLLSRKALSSPKKREFVEELLSLCKLSQVIAFAVGLRYPQTPAMQGFSEPNTFIVISDLVERVEAMMAERYPNESAVVVFDSQEDRKDKERALEFGNYLYGTPRGRSVSHVADVPLFASSTVTKGLQVADVFAYALAQQNMGRPDVRPYCDRIREMEWRRAENDETQPRRGFRFRDISTQEERIGGPPNEVETPPR
jgi:hypothetical protein